MSHMAEECGRQCEQDAGKQAGRTQGASLLWTGIVCVGIFFAYPNVGLARWPGCWTWLDAHARPSKPGQFASDLHMFRAKCQGWRDREPARVNESGHMAPRSRPEARPAGKTTPVSFTRIMSPRTKCPSIVRTPLVCVLPAECVLPICPRPANLPASRQLIRILRDHALTISPARTPRSREYGVRGGR